MIEEFKTDTRVVHCQKEEYDIYIGRPSFWENPFTHIKNKKTLAKYTVRNREEAIFKYREWILSQPEKIIKIKTLNGKRLGCWCKDPKNPKSCHGDVLIEILNDISNRTTN